PASPPGPGTTLSTPGGTPASAASSASRRAVSGVAEAGLTTSELPSASAGAAFQGGMARGECHGTMRAQTPTASPDGRSGPGARAGSVWPAEGGDQAGVVREAGGAHLVPAARLLEGLPPVARLERRQLLRRGADAPREPQEHPRPFGGGGPAPVARLIGAP